MSAVGGNYCPTHGHYSTTSGQCPRCGSFARLTEAPWGVPHPTVTFTYGSGWECPRCHRIYGPQQAECYRCNSPTNLPEHSDALTEREECAKIADACAEAAKGSPTDLVAGYRLVTELIRKRAGAAPHQAREET